jgi:sterol desaturase/sphingolipid hydroxylase (fatty acid hydroxylase superfamily)
MQRAFHFLFVPLLLTACVTAWAFRAEGQAALTARAVRLDFASCVLLSLIALIWLAEQLFPARREWNVGLFANEPGLGRDLLYLFFITQFSALFITLTSTPLKAALTEHGFGFDTPHLWPTAAPFAAKVALAFFVVEFFSYWLHRAAHRVPLLWQFHSTHHVITHVTGLKALHTHPVENVFFYLVRHLPLLLVGAGADEVIAATTLGGMLGILAHANISVSTRGLGLVVNFPSYHAVHHSAVLAESNSNFGCHTVVFDRLFGTFREAPHEPLQVGVSPVGPRSLWRSLIWPFYRRVS